MIHELINLPNVICVQETWLKPQLDFVIPGFISIRKDRTQTAGGGCAIFVKKGVSHREVNIDTQDETIKVEVWTSIRKQTIINYYNPCGQLSLLELS